MKKNHSRGYSVKYIIYPKNKKDKYNNLDENKIKR